MEIDDLLTKYAPKLKETIPQWVWEAQKVNGKQYYIPNYQKMVSTGCGLFMLEEKAEKFLDKEIRNVEGTQSYNCFDYDFYLKEPYTENSFSFDDFSITTGLPPEGLNLAELVDFGNKEVKFEIIQELL